MLNRPLSNYAARPQLANELISEFNGSSYVAFYKQPAKLHVTQDARFDVTHEPGSPVQISGIYECQGCGREYSLNEGTPFPPQNHHQHTQAHGPIRWRLLVWSDGRALDNRQ